jgi:hypothetical protein
MGFDPTHSAAIVVPKQGFCALSTSSVKFGTGLGRTKLYELIGDGHLATTTVERRRLVVVRSLLSLLEPNTSV